MRDPSISERLSKDLLAAYDIEIAKDDAITARRVTSYTPSLAFSVLDSLGHQRHRLRPRTYLD